MKRSLRWSCIMIVFVLQTLATPVSAAEEGKRLTTDKEFRELVAGRQLAGDQTTLLYDADGTITGITRGEQIMGKWSWQGTTMCRRVTVGSKDLGNDCQAIFVIGDLVIIVRDEGKGRAYALRLRSERGHPGELTEFACLSC